ncbi:MAG: hypothetical protein ACXWCH_33280 [Burkholderiales bacterium]
MTRSTTIKRVAAVLVAVGVEVGLCQPIRIPDFREGPTVAANMPEGPCDDCAVVRSIREVHKRRDSPVSRTSTAGSTMGNERVIGAVIVMMPFGPGSSEATSFVGGVGTPEAQERLGELSYEVTLRMADGTLRTVERREGRQYQVGDRVRVTEGRWELLPPTR